MSWVNISLFALSVGVFIALRPWSGMGTRRNSIVATALLIACVGLTVPSIYLWVDATLGARNIANLILHLLLNFAFLFIGLALAATHLALGAARLLAGPIGSGVLVLVSALMIGSFTLSDVSASATGLVGVPRDQFSVTAYATVNKAYPAFVSACILGPLSSSALNRRRSRALRVFSMSMAIAFALTLLALLVQAAGFVPGIDPTRPLDIGSWSAVAFFLVGMLVLLTERSLHQHNKQQHMTAEHKDAD